MAAKETRKPPVHRTRVTVKRHQYDVLTNRYDANWPALVSSASQPDDLWIVWRQDGAFRCACQAYQWRGDCSHVQAAVQADTLLFPTDVWPGPAEAAEYETWLDSIDDNPPDEDERWLSDYERATYVYKE